MKIPKKQFDAVSTMREIRDRLSAQVEGMSLEEEKRFNQEQVRQPKSGRSKAPSDVSSPPARRAQR